MVRPGISRECIGSQLNKYLCRGSWVKLKSELNSLKRDLISQDSVPGLVSLVTQSFIRQGSLLCLAPVLSQICNPIPGFRCQVVITQDKIVMIVGYKT